MSTRNRTTRKKRSAREFLESLTGGPVTFAQLLESIRLGEEVSQAEMARILRISRAHLCDIEKGRRTVSPKRAAQFAKVLGYSELHFMELALQDLVRESGIEVRVSLKAA